MSLTSDDPTICFCHAVKRSQIIEAIEQGADTHAEIQLRTLASTGCGGCTADILEILEVELKKLKNPALP